MKIDVTKSSVVRDIILTILTFGIWNIYVQMRQIWDVNDLISSSDDKIPSIAIVFIFSLLTLGLYFCYHEYKLTKKLHILLDGHRDKAIEITMGVLAFLGLWFLVDSYQQSLINKYINQNLAVQTLNTVQNTL